jgi:hypothetical protein
MCATNATLFTLFAIGFGLTLFTSLMRIARQLAGPASRRTLAVEAVISVASGYALAAVLAEFLPAPTVALLMVGALALGAVTLRAARSRTLAAAVE